MTDSQGWDEKKQKRAEIGGAMASLHGRTAALNEWARRLHYDENTGGPFQLQNRNLFFDELRRVELAANRMDELLG